MALKKNTIMSNEPGFYKEGEFGVRIENLLLLIEDKTATAKEKIDKNNLIFENVTMCPYDRNLIMVQYLDKHEIEQINKYH